MERQNKSPLPKVPNKSKFVFSVNKLNSRLFPTPRDISTSPRLSANRQKVSMSRPSTAVKKPLCLPQTQQTQTKTRPQTAIVKPQPVEVFLKSARLLEQTNKSRAERKVFNELIKKENPKEIPGYINNFVLSRIADEYALKIQKCWRRYIEKIHWRGLFNHRIWNRRDVLLRIFIAWRGFASKDFKTIESCYNKFEKL